MNQWSVDVTRNFGTLERNTLSRPLPQIRPHAEPNVTGRNVPDGGPGRRVADIVDEVEHSRSERRRDPRAGTALARVTPDLAALNSNLGHAETG